MTTEQIVRFRGKDYKVMPDELRAYPACAACAFDGDQRHRCDYETWDAEGDVAPACNCIAGQHYYVEVMS